MMTRRKASASFGGFLSFRWMITPAIVRVIFVLGLAYCVWRGVQVLLYASGEGADASDRLANMTWVALEACYWFVAMTFGLRLVCEAVIVLFRINEALAEMQDNGDRIQDAVIQIRENTAE